MIVRIGEVLRHTLKLSAIKSDLTMIVLDVSIISLLNIQIPEVYMKEYKLYIKGNEVESPEIVEVKNPYNDEVVGIVHRYNKNHIEQSIAASLEAYEITRKLPTYKRSDVLFKISMLLEENKSEFTDMMISEVGKPKKLAALEVDRAIDTFRIASEEVMRMYGDVIPLDTSPASENRVGITRRFPIGICLGITPFNFPLNLVAHKLAPCIAVGNTMLLRPSSECPITSIMLGKICSQAGLENGALTVIPSSPAIAEQLVMDDRIKKVSFTGSAGIGWKLKSLCGKKKITLELGGNAAAILEKDADLDFAVPRLAIGSFAYSGQVCISVQRIFIHEDIFQKFTSMFLNYIKTSVKYGDPRDEDVIVGPMINKQEIDRVESWLQNAIANGAHVLFGNEREWNVMKPTVLTRVRPDLDISCKEAFAPVVVLESYRDFDDALFMANDSMYGLQAGVFTRDVKKIFKAYEELDVGGVIINDYPTFRVDQMPYGGVKDSGFGREGVRYAMEEMTELKLLTLNL
jgi:acyl-CoA reductase-like NAD-dependent aldehyde dehydrogenase